VAQPQSHTRKLGRPAAGTTPVGRRRRVMPRLAASCPSAEHKCNFLRPPLDVTALGCI